MRYPTRILLSAFLLAGISACSTPRENCIAGATADYRTLQASISETKLNIARGYAVHRQSVPYVVPNTCYRTDPNTNATIPYPCPTTAYRTVETPVSINVVQEKKKLSGYLKLLPKYKAQADAGTRQCIAQYPDEA